MKILIAVTQCVLLLKIDILDKFSEVQNGWVLLIGNGKKCKRLITNPSHWV